MVKSQPVAFSKLRTWLRTHHLKEEHSLYQDDQKPADVWVKRGLDSSRQQNNMGLMIIILERWRQGGWRKKITMTTRTDSTLHGRLVFAMFLLAYFPLDCLADWKYLVGFYSSYIRTALKIRLPLWIFKMKYFMFALRVTETLFAAFFSIFSFRILA